jgi:hypothetical protein
MALTLLAVFVQLLVLTLIVLLAVGLERRKKIVLGLERRKNIVLGLERRKKSVLLRGRLRIGLTLKI